MRPCWSALAVVAALISGPAAAAEPTCRGTLSGSVKATFECRVRLIDVNGTPVLQIDGKAPIEGIPSYAPGAFELPGPVKPGRLTLDELGQGRATVAAEGGTLFVASKTLSQRGEVTLEILSVKALESGGQEVHGTYRARLIPAGGGKSGEVIVLVTF